MARNIPLTKQGLTARMILGVTPLATQIRARTVKVLALKSVPNDRGLRTFVGTTRSSRDDEGNPIIGQKYQTKLIVLNRHGHLDVDCECMYHVYWGAEVALNMRNAAEIIHSNGKAPMIRNPKLTPYGCKHAVAMMKRLMDAGKIR